MAGRPGNRSQEGAYLSSSPGSSDPHDPFSNAQAADTGRYYDNDSVEHYPGQRDTYASDGSNAGLNDDDRYYDNSGGYDYGR